MTAAESAFTHVPDMIPFTLEPAPPGDARPAAPVFFSEGPWTPAGGFDDAETVLSADRFSVADLYGRLPIRRANAALIAAAPDLYYAARIALDKLEHLPGQSVAAMAALGSAIRKAEGRS